MYLKYSNIDNKEGAEIVEIPELPEKLLQYSIELYLKGKYKEAEYFLQEVRKKAKNKSVYIDSLFWLGQVYYSQGKFDKLIQVYEKIINNVKNYKNLKLILLKLGISYLKIGNREKSEYFLKKLIKEFPNSYESKRAKQIIREMRNGQSV